MRCTGDTGIVMIAFVINCEVSIIPNKNITLKPSKAIFSIITKRFLIRELRLPSSTPVDEKMTLRRIYCFLETRKTLITFWTFWMKLTKN